MVVLPVLLTEDSEAKLVHDMELTNAAGSLINGISGVSGASSVSALSPKTKACKTTVIGATQNQVGLLVTAELEKSLKDCKVKVDRIAKECRAGNRKFRDLEFDLGNNKKRCLQGLSSGLGDPPDVRRVTEIYENPKFFVDGPDSNDIVQGELGNCGFLSALSTISTSKGLIEELCVARDEEVGVYGFVFFQGDKWVHVIIDDQLFWSLPKYEELEQREKELYHEDKEMYNKLSRKLGKGLHFAKSGTEGETWVPLIEKAYAKLHGDFESLEGGWSLEAIEEMTGGISITYRSKDILDVDRFWHEELMHATHDRLFGCSFTALENNRNQSEMIRVQGLYSGHAYSILRVKECRGKRFIVIRNPWGKCEWTGRWSDGSKDWNGEWAQVLKELDHVLGDDGEFVMEYSDFLDTWELIERTTIFGPSWKLSSLWLQVPDSPRMHPWTYGDVMFYFTLPKPSFTFIVLSQLDTRNLKQLHGTSMWHLDFVIYKRGETECRGASTYAYLFSRSVLCELELEAGEYVVYPRLDREYGFPVDEGNDFDQRKLARVMTGRAKARSIASNFGNASHKKHFPTLLEDIIEHDLEKVDSTETDSVHSSTDSDDGGEEGAITTTTTISVVEQVQVVQKKAALQSSSPVDPKPSAAETQTKDTYEYVEVGHNTVTATVIEETVAESEPLFLGLRIYAQTDAAVDMRGRLRVFK